MSSNLYLDYIYIFKYLGYLSNYISTCAKGFYAFNIIKKILYLLNYEFYLNFTYFYRYKYWVCDYVLPKNSSIDYLHPIK